MPKGDPLRFLTSILLQNFKNDRDPLETLGDGFVFHVRGFGCVQNQVLSTYGKSAPCTKRGHIALN